MQLHDFPSGPQFRQLRESEFDGACSMPCLAGSAGFSLWLMNHQIAARTITISRMIAHIGNPLELAAAAGARAAALVAALAAVVALDAAELAVLEAAAPRPPRPASSPVAPSALDSSPGSAAAIAFFWAPNIAAIEDGSDQLEGSCWPIAPIAACATAPIVDWAAGWVAPENWLKAPTMLESPEPPSRPPSRLAPSAERAHVAAADRAGKLGEQIGVRVRDGVDQFLGAAGRSRRRGERAEKHRNRGADELLRHRFVDADRSRQAADELRREDLGYQTDEIECHWTSLR